MRHLAKDHIIFSAFIEIIEVLSVVDLSLVFFVDTHLGLLLLDLLFGSDWDQDALELVMLILHIILG